MRRTDGAADGINFEYTEDGTCNINLEGGQMIDSVSGGLSYLLYDVYNGGSVAFYVFYQSAGKMVAAYAKGAKDITYGVEITDKNNVLGFDVDGTGYSLTLLE